MIGPPAPGIEAAAACCNANNWLCCWFIGYRKGCCADTGVPPADIIYVAWPPGPPASGRNAKGDPAAPSDGLKPKLGVGAPAAPSIFSHAAVA